MIKRWSLFLDDERFPPAAEPQDWIIARNCPDAVNLIKKFGLPYRMSLDHDLGLGVLNGLQFVKWLVDQDMDGEINLDTIETFYVHSQNPVGAENMRKLFDQYMTFGRE